MSLFVKVCGITDEFSARVAERSGVDAIGFVFADSPRMVLPAVAGRIAGTVSDSILKVAVFRRPTQREIDEVLVAFEPDVVQADADSPIVLPAGIGFLPVFREGGISIDPTGSGRDRLVLYEGATSGVGLRVDWGVAARLAGEVRLVLAGGLNVGNVGEAIRTVRPFGVDVSSGVEVSPGIKDPTLISAFVATARSSAELLEVT